MKIEILEKRVLQEMYEIWKKPSNNTIRKKSIVDKLIQDGTANRPQIHSIFLALEKNDMIKHGNMDIIFMMPEAIKICEKEFEDKVIEKKSIVFSHDVYEHIENNTYTLEDFEESLKPYWKQFQEPNLRLQFLYAFWRKLAALVKEHEQECTNPDCRISEFKIDLDIYLKQEIKKLSILTGEGFNPLEEEQDRFLFLRTSYLLAKDKDAGRPYSMVISTEEVTSLLGFTIQKVGKILSELAQARCVQDFGGEFLVTQAGYEYLLEFEKNSIPKIQASDIVHSENEDENYNQETLYLSPLPPETTLKTFIIYSRNDQSYKQELEKHLRPLAKRNYITIYTDTQIEPGVDWNKEICSNLSDAHLILILVSSDLFASDYIEEVEVKEVFARKASGDITLEIIPILIRASDWKLHSEISKLNLLPNTGTAVSQWLDKDEAYVQIVNGIKKVIRRLTGKSIAQ